VARTFDEQVLHTEGLYWRRSLLHS
jgi:hypothetical protein